MERERVGGGCWRESEGERERKKEREGRKLRGAEMQVITFLFTAPMRAM